MVKRRAADGNTALAAVAPLLDWYAREARDLPWRNNPDPYGVWISEVMLQQTQVTTVIPYWLAWMVALPGPAALADASDDQVLKLWEGLGYYSRARNLKKAAQIIVREHQGRFPREFDQVRALPGIGDYTAGAVCSIAFNEPTPAVDGNVIRVLTRVHGITGDPKLKETRQRLWRTADAWMRVASARPMKERPCASLTQALMELGAKVCAPRNPECPLCPLQRYCFARTHNLIHEFPQIAPRPPAIPRRFVVLVVRRGARYLVRQRPAGSVNARLWEFPNFEAAPAEAGAVERVLGRFEMLNLQPMMRLKHSITKYRISLEVFEGTATPAKEPADLAGRWLELEAMHKLAFTSAHGKIARKLA